MFLSPFLIGLAGSLHCIGMCNPLVIAASGNGRKAFYRNLVYNIGRILTYGLLGSLVGLVGSGLTFAGVQQGVALIAGVAILTIGIVNTRIFIPSVISQKISKIIGAVRGKVKPGVLLLGMINGILPCGITLIALGYCITLSSPTDGFLAMIFFGLGTLPAMLGLSSVLKWIVGRLRIGYRGLQTALMILSGIILIGRGLSEAHTAGHQKVYDIVVCGMEPGQ